MDPDGVAEAMVTEILMGMISCQICDQIPGGWINEPRSGINDPQSLS